MASTYTHSLNIQLIGNGEQSGVWGTTTNTNWSLIEQAVSGVQTITMSNANRTLTVVNGVLDEARNMVLVVNGTNSAIYQVIAPLVPKFYVVTNNTVGGNAITIGGSTGLAVTIPNGVTAQVYCDGTDFYSAQTSSAGSFLVNGNLTVNGAVSLGSSLSATTISAATFTGGTVSGTTVTASTQFSGPGTGLTGTAASLSIGGTAAYVPNLIIFNNGGTGSASGASYNGSAPQTISYNTIGAPSASGSGATGTWGINISGNSASVTNGVYTTSSYTDPSWIASLSASKISGQLAVANGGTGASSITGVVYGNGTSAFTAATGAQITSAIGSSAVQNATAATTATTANALNPLNSYTVSNLAATGIFAAVGAAAVPNYSFAGHTDSGLFCNSVDGSIGIAYGGLPVAAFGASQYTTFYGNINMTGVSPAGVFPLVIGVPPVDCPVDRGIAFNMAAGSAIVQYFTVNSGGTISGNITCVGASTSYNTSSDYRLKTNIRPLLSNSALDTIDRINPVSFDFLPEHGGQASVGFIAHELQDVVPQAVSGEKDGVHADGSIFPQGVDSSYLVPYLVAAVKELRAEIAALKNAN